MDRIGWSAPAGAREYGGPLPSIHINPNRPAGPFASARGFSSESSQLSPSAMSIPGSDRNRDVPPPLPPPRFPPVDNPIPEANREDYHRRNEWSTSSFSTSGYGSLGGSLADDGPSYKRRDSRSTPRTDRDEGYSSLSSARSPESLVAKFVGVHHDQYQLRASADAYDNRQLAKLDSRRVLDNRSPPRRHPLSSSTGDAPVRTGLPTLAPLSLPSRTKASNPVLDSPRFAETPHTNAGASPRSNPFVADDRFRSPAEAFDFDRSPVARGRRTNSGSVSDEVSVQSSSGYDATGEEADFAMDETRGMHRLHIDDGYSRDYHMTGVGQKRRASSPPGDDSITGMPSQSDVVRRREGVSRGSPTPRLSVIPAGSAMPPMGRTSSYTSNMSSISSITTSFGRRSPPGLSPGGMSPTDTMGSPYNTPISLTASPRSSISRIPHQRTLSNHMTSPRKLTEMPKAAGVSSKIQGFLMCDCCPKKPKKFDTQEELQAHEQEKQYECSFCGNRFKNKNEAERHQNSLHVRRHSWSCSALSGYDRAFHDSTNRPGEADTCGYCGEEFGRNGVATGNGGMMMRQATDQDWEERIRHLQDVHKFRECNSSKKFYRADHFRQHLKHSHAGTSGKWTNVLENACMLEEDPTPR